MFAPPRPKRLIMDVHSTVLRLLPHRRYLTVRFCLPLALGRRFGVLYPCELGVEGQHPGGLKFAVIA